MSTQFPESEALTPMQSSHSSISNQGDPPEQPPVSGSCSKPLYYYPISRIPISSDDPVTQADIFAEVQRVSSLADNPPVYYEEPSLFEPSILQPSPPTLPTSVEPPATISTSDYTSLMGTPQAIQIPDCPPTISSKRPAANFPIRSTSAPPNPADGEEAFRLFGCTLQAPPFAASTARAASEYEVMEKAASVIIFVNIEGNIYYFNGICYKLLQHEEALGKILDNCREDIKDAGKYSLLKNAYQFLTVDSRFRPPDEWINQGRDYVTFLNGNLNWRTGCCEPHSFSVFTTYSIQANYLGQNAVLPGSRFMSFLSQISGGSAELIERVLQIIGYCLVPDTGGKSGFLFQGVSDSGKSLLCSFLSSFFPKEKVSALGIHDLGQRFAASNLENAALCTTPDMPSQPLGEKATSLIKSLSGNDLIQADRKYKSHAKFQFKGKFVMSSNHALFPKDRDPAFENRIVTVPFLYSLPRRAQDPQLLEKLSLERDYAASISIDAYFRLRENSYLFAGAFRMNMPEALSDSAASPELCEMITAFLMTSFTPDPNSKVFVSEAYSLFCRQFHQTPSLALFGRHFIAAASRLHNGTHMRKRIQPGENPVSCVYGIRLLHTNHENLSMLQDDARKDGKPGGYSKASIHKTHNVLSSIMRTAVEWELIERNPCSKVKVPSAPETADNIKFFTPAQTAAFLAYIEEPHSWEVSAHNRVDDTGKGYSVGRYTIHKKLPQQLQVLFQLAIYTGMRKGELLALKWDDIDLEHDIINITKAVSIVKGQATIKIPKTKTSRRSIAIPHALTLKLKKLHTAQAEYRLKVGDYWQGEDWVFTQDNGKMMNYSTPYHALQNTINWYNKSHPEEEALPVIPFHGLRHTSATLLIAGKQDIKTVFSRLGHAQTSTTMNIYTHALQEGDRKAAETLEAVLKDQA